jgi:hypothetical protein
VAKELVDFVTFFGGEMGKQLESLVKVVTNQLEAVKEVLQTFVTKLFESSAKMFSAQFSVVTDQIVKLAGSFSAFQSRVEKDFDAIFPVFKAVSSLLPIPNR